MYSPNQTFSRETEIFHMKCFAFRYLKAIFFKPRKVSLDIEGLPPWPGIPWNCIYVGTLHSLGAVSTLDTITTLHYTKIDIKHYIKLQHFAPLSYTSLLQLLLQLFTTI